jgi:PAS domain S-box-containing protein
MRMAFLTACGFFLIGCIIFLLLVNNAKASGIAHILIVPVAILSHLVTVSYILGVRSFGEFGEIQVALTTGIAFGGICVIVFFMRPDTWLLKESASGEPGGLIARKLLPPLMILPVVIGWLRINGERAGLFESDEGVTIVAITYTICFVVLIWRTSISANRMDRKRKASEEALRESEKRLQRAQEIAHLGSWELDIVNNQLNWSDEVYRIFGLVPGEFDATYDAFLDAIHPDDRTAVDAVYSGSLSEGIDAYEIEHRVVSKLTGEIRFVQEKCSHIRDESGKAIKSIGMIHDITEYKMSEMALRESEEKYRHLFEGMTEAFALHEIITDEKGIAYDYRFLSINPAFEKQTGLKAENIVGKKVSEVLPSTEKYWIETYGRVALTGKSIKFEDYSSELNSYFRVSAFSPKEGYFAVIFENITNRILAERELQSTKNYLENLINYANAPIIVWNTVNEILLFNHAFERMTGYSSAEVEGKKLDLLFPSDSLEVSNSKIKDALTRNWETIEIPILTKDKEIRTVLWNSANIYEADNKTILSTIAQGSDITERIKAEQEVSKAKEKLEMALESGNIGIWEWDIRTDSFEWDERMGNMLDPEGKSIKKTYNNFEEFIFEDDLHHFRRVLQRSLKEGFPFELIYRIKQNKNDIIYINTRASVEKDNNGIPVKMTGVCFDITDLKKGTEQTLFNLNEELLRSNKELEQFAYVASHDLQEPLRMISSFTQLLEMRYRDKLDHEAHEFIKYAVDGATQMQNLINDLLEYSRVETRGKELSVADMHNILGRTINNLSLEIKKKNALVTNDELPTILADRGQMVQLFQNLVGNALKFCDTKPLIHISAEEETDHYLFKIKDNGIGIEPQYFERIFQIFQRLHPKDEYGGTGIGLAICRRIVERHGGKIWVESKPGQGTEFKFTIRKKQTEKQNEKQFI